MYTHVYNVGRQSGNVAGTRATHTTRDVEEAQTLYVAMTEQHQPPPTIQGAAS